MAKRTNVPIAAPLDDGREHPLRRFVWTRRIAAICALLLLFVVLSRSWWMSREERRLEEELAAWRAEGLPTTLSDLQMPFAPESENAAAALIRAAREAEKIPEWQSGDVWDLLTTRPWSSAQRARVAQIVGAYAWALAQLRSAEPLTRVYFETWGEDPSVPAELDPRRPPWSEINHLAFAVALAAEQAGRRGDEEQMLRRLEDLLFISGTMRLEPSRPSALVALSIEACARDCLLIWAHTLKLQSLQTRASAARIIRWLEQNDDWGEAKAGLACEVARQLPRLRSQLPTDSVIYVGSELDSTWLGTATIRFLAPARVRGERYCLRALRRDLNALRSAGDYPRALAAMSVPTGATGLTGIQPLDSGLIAVTPVYFGGRRSAQTQFRAILGRRFARLSMACRMYAVDHAGKLPRRLAELVPEYLTAVPADPFDPRGGAVRYVPNFTLAPLEEILYSVGESGVDAIASGAFKPALTDHLRWSAPNYVALLKPDVWVEQPSMAPSATPDADQ